MTSRLLPQNKIFNLNQKQLRAVSLTVKEVTVISTENDKKSIFLSNLKRKLVLSSRFLSYLRMLLVITL